MPDWMKRSSTSKRFVRPNATRTLRTEFDVRTVQHWMGHKSLEATMRYLVRRKFMRDLINYCATVPGLDERKETTAFCYPEL